MELTIQVNPVERTVRFREVHALAAGDSCAVTLDGIRGADVPSLRMALYRDAASDSPVASCPSFAPVQGHPNLATGTLLLDTVEMASWFAAVRPETPAATGSGQPQARPEDAAERAVRTDGWLVVSDSTRTWAACRVPVVLRPGAGTSGVTDPTSLAALVGGLVSAALAGKADKAADATSGNLASLDAAGNLVDSTVKPSDFAPAAHAADATIHHTEAEIGQIAAAKVAEVVAGAPSTLDTLKEIADVIGTESGSGAGGILKRVSDLEGGKVDKIQGKGLSANDYTNADKAKVQAALTEHQDVSGKRGLGDLAVYVPSAYSEWTYTVSPALPEGASITVERGETYGFPDSYWLAAVIYQDGGNPYPLGGDASSTNLTLTSRFDAEGPEYTVTFTRTVTAWTKASPADALAKTSQLPTVPSAYTSTPAMDGVGGAGSSTAWARGDHVHPSDTSKADKTDLPYPFVPATVTQEGPQLPASAFPIAYTYNGTSYSGITSSDVELDADVLYGGWAVKHTATLNLLCHYTSTGVFESSYTGITSLTFNGSSTPPSMEFPNVLTVSPRTVATYTAGTTAAAFTVAVGTGVADAARDCVLVVDCTAAGAVAPTVTWPSNFHPRTDAEEIAPVAGVRNVFYISEYATGEFVVGGWHEEAE